MVALILIGADVLGRQLRTAQGLGSCTREGDLDGIGMEF